MRVGRADTGDGANRAVIEHDGAFRALDIPPTSGFDALVAALERAGPEERAAGPPLSDSKLVAPLAPNKIVAVGLNYQDHLHETGMEAPTEPLIFAKFPSSVIGPDEPILIDRGLTERVDWEVELTVVIGQTLRDVPVDRALEGVFGYTVANDVSARDVQFNDGQWVRGKSFDTFCPLGPVIVTADEIPDPQALRMWTRVNGETVQDSSTKHMLFPVADLICWCSRSFTLKPGDVILTGTPHGCGAFMDPPRFLAPGDVVETEIEGIGTLRNRVIDATPPAVEPGVTRQ